MNENQKDQTCTEVETYHLTLPVEEDEINLLDLLLIIVKYKKMIFFTCVAIFVLACGATLLMPNIYTATARILPPQNEAAGIGAQLGGMNDLAALAGISVGGRSSTDLYVAMLQSRKLADAVIERFGLIERFKWNTRIRAYGALHGKVKISAEKKTGLITIAVEDKDPKFAAELANVYADELKNLNVRLNLSNAGRQRQFLENRLEVVKKDLLLAEDKLKAFQERNKAFRIDDQAKAIIGAISKLKGELANKEVELGVLLSSQTEQNPQVKALREGIVQIKDQMRRLEQSSTGKKVSGDIFFATSDVPKMGVQYARLLREFKVQETIYELLTKQYELAKIEEAKNTSTIQVFDSAFVPEQKSKPRRRMIVLLTTIVTGFMAILFAFIREHGKKMSEDDRKRWEEICGQFKLWERKSS